MEFRVLIRFRCYKLGEIHFRVSLRGSKILVNICWLFRQHWSTPSCHYGSKNGITHGWKGVFTYFIYIWMVFWVLTRFWCYKLRKIYFRVSLRGSQILVNMCWSFSQQRDAFWSRIWVKLAIFRCFLVHFGRRIICEPNNVFWEL